MAKSDPLLLFSANSLLAYRIAEKYYGNIHYVWCATAFGSPDLTNPLIRNPRSSLPYERFLELKKDTTGVPDRHSNMIISQRTGIKKGASEKFRRKQITRKQRDEIFAAVTSADPQDFTPLMFVMPFAKVKKIAQTVPIKARAHPLSDEWLIPQLPRDCFDVITF